MKSNDKKNFIVAQNKKAYHDYFVEETYEAGIELFGTEVKSVRQSAVSIKESWCDIKNGEAFILGMNISAFVSAAIAVSLNSAAYVAEIVRAGIEVVDKGQMEAARSLGMKKSMAMRLIIIPQAVKNILPAIGNEFVAVIKESSMASVIGVAELTFSAKVVQGATYLSLEPLMIAAVFYFVLTFSLGRLIGYFERRLTKK